MPPLGSSVGTHRNGGINKSHLHSTSCQSIAIIMFGTEKLAWWVYGMVKKFENMFTRLGTIRDERDRQLKGCL